jgi:signal transduction histidine kinase
MEGGSPAGTESPPTGETLNALLRRVLPGAETLVTRRFPAVPLILPDGGALHRWEGARSGVAVPLRHGGQIQGVVIFGWRSHLPVRGEGVRVAEALGAHASLALRNARLYDDMKQAAERRDRFFSAMSHDLRTPITAIVGYSELLLDGVVGNLPARQLEMVDRISQVAGHLSQLVNDILDLAKLEAGKMEFHRESVRLEALVEDAIVAIEPQAASKGLVLLRELDEVRDAVLQVDRVRVRQVLVNLLYNAVKFTPAGEVRVSAMIEPDRMWIAVRDTGPGLGDEDHEALFEEFLQVASGSGTKSEPGAGLGLAISRRLARAMGGDLIGDNAPGGGALFTLILPLEPDSPVSATDHP